MNNVNNQLEAIKAELESIETKLVYVHELFGFDKPLKGFEEQVKIAANPHPLTPELDPDYEFTPSLVRRAMLSMAAGESIMLTGDKGTGKSSFVQQLMARLNRPLLAINAGPGVDETDLLGTKTIQGGDVKSFDGLLSYAVRKGIPILIDELCTLRPGVLVAINDILQGDKVITLKHHGIDPETDPRELRNLAGSMSIMRHPSFRIFATDNTGGKAKKDGRFAGVNTQNSAVRSRLTGLKVVFMAPEKEVAALTRYVVKQHGEEAMESDVCGPEVIDLMVEFAFRFRAAFEQGEAYDNISIRELKRWANKHVMYGDLHESFIDAIYTNLEESDQHLAEKLFAETTGADLRMTEEYLVNAQEMLDAFTAVSEAA